MATAHPGRRSAILLLLLSAAILSTGCAVFPQGAYWRPIAGRPSEGAAGKAVPRTEEPAPPTAAEAAALRARLQEVISRRWSSEDLARSARAMSGWAGTSAYGDAMQTVVSFYVEPITYRRLVVAGLESLRAALESPEFRKRFPEADDAEKRGRFAEALDILILKARAADPWFAFQAADWLTVTMEKNRAILGLPDGAVVAEFLFGAMDSLDPYSRYLTPEMLRIYREQMGGAYTGIGAEVAARDKRIFISKVFEGGGAAKAGLKTGDEIVAVEGQPVSGLPLSEVSRRLRGRPGTKTAVKVRTGGEGEPHEVSIERTVIHLPAVREARIVDAERGVGYVRLAEFQDSAEQELRRAVDGLAAKGAKALILDLRGNPGGSLLEAVWVAGMFLQGGPVIRTRGRMLGATWNYDVPLLERQAWRGPLAVLTDEDTASASEAVASALEARGRATVIGRRTFGKGAVQILFPANWGQSAVCLTMARVYDVKDRCLDGPGVTPNREVAPAATPPASLAEDPVVRAAVEALTSAPQPAQSTRQD